ncbi:MAG: thiamine phosphate synthase [Planctomycetota bacterium]
MSSALDPEAARDRLGRARLMLLFTPELAGEADPLDALESALPSLDVVQVRLKSAEHPDGASPARALLGWAERVLELVAGRVPVLVNDRVDVCAALGGRGLAGVHVGDRDTPVPEVRELLGPEPLVGLSTHGPRDVAAAATLDVDYLGFGPVYPTATKGYERGKGPEAAWVAAEASPVPVFPIGGIDLSNADELEHVGRACVGSAILSAADPAAAAAGLRELLQRS